MPAALPARVRTLLVLVAVAGLFGSTLYRAAPVAGRPFARSDLPAFRAGAERLRAGEDPLDARGPRGWPYVYPPTFAALLVPLAPLPDRAAAGVWFAVSLSALLGGGALFRRALGRRGPPSGAADWVPIALVAIPAASALARGQVAPLLTGILAAAAGLLLRRRDVAGGAMLALAIAIKVTPALLLPGLAVARRWRALGAAAGALALGLLVVPAPWIGVGGAARSCARFADDVVLRFVRQPDAATLTAAGSVRVQAPTNQSLVSHVARRTDGATRAVLLTALVLAALVPGLVLCARGDPRPPPAAFAALLAATLVVSPIAWHHHHVLAWPALAVLAQHRGRPAARAALVAFALLSLLHFAGGSTVRELGLLGWATLALVPALAVVGARPAHA